MTTWELWIKDIGPRRYRIPEIIFNHKRNSKKNLKSYLILLTKFGLDTDGFGKRFLKNEVHEMYKGQEKEKHCFTNQQ